MHRTSVRSGLILLAGLILFTVLLSQSAGLTQAVNDQRNGLHSAAGDRAPAPVDSADLASGITLGAPSPVIYVDGDWQDVDGAWVGYYADLQSALAAATPGVQIWVADGVYKPGPGPRDTFNLPDGVAIYGGFAGTETGLDQRDWRAHLTILSGDIDGNDATDSHGIVNSTADIVGENSDQVVTASGVGSATLLDGFTITAGQATGKLYEEQNGAGMLILEASPVVRHVTFSGNLAVNEGGGMYVGNSSAPTISEAIFRANKASRGGGMSNWPGSQVSLTNSLFTGNQATSTGSAILNFETQLTMTNVTASGNSGLAIHNYLTAPDGWMVMRNSIVMDTIIGDLADAAYSLILGGYPGTAILNADPLFVDVDGSDDILNTADDNLRLQPASPAVDAGNDADVPAGISADLAGNPRFAGAVDMGAYEVQRIYLPSIIR